MAVETGCSGPLDRLRAVQAADVARKIRPEPTGDFSTMLPEGDPIRRELESLFPPYLNEDGTPRDPITGALPDDENFLSAHPNLDVR